MNTHSRILAVLALAVVATTFFAGQAQAGPAADPLGILDTSGNNPATGAPWANGDQYRLVFHTSATRTAEETDIAEYNSWVQGLADASTAYNIGADDGVTWKVIGSTAEIDARDNTATNPDVDGTGCALFLLDGSTVVANDNVDLWDGTIQNIINITESGTEWSHWPWTGTYWDGTKSAGHGGSGAALGGPGQVGQGQASAADKWVWRVWTMDPITTMLPMYAMSDPITLGSAFDPTDFDQDGASDLIDINALTAVTDLTIGLPVALSDPKYDLTGDDMINGADLDQWLTDAATINGFGSPYLKGDANLDGDCDVFAIDGSGDAQILSSNLGTPSGAVWGDGDFNGDGDVDVFAIDGSGDAQLLSSNLGSSSDATAGTAEAIYDAATGELTFDVGEGIAVIGVGAEGMDPGAVDTDSGLGAPLQNDGETLAYFSANGLPVGMFDVGAVLPKDLTADDITFLYTPLGGETAVAPVTVVPEPSTIAMLLVLGAMALCWRRRNA